MCESQRSTVQSELAKTSRFLEGLGDGSALSVKVRTGTCGLNLEGPKGAIRVEEFQDCTITLKKFKGLAQDLNC